MPPSSSGGVMLIEMLNILEGYQSSAQIDAERALHLMIEAMKLAYADRAAFLGDPATCRSAARAAHVEALRRRAARARIDPERARPAADIRAGSRRRARRRQHHAFLGGRPVRQRGRQHHTLNFSYGVGLVAEGTGVLLNNELDDFAAKPGAPNAFGLVGGDANAPGPGKRPLSSMTPTIVLKDGKPFLRHRLARRQPHHHDGAAGDRQRDRPRDVDCRRGRRAARASPVVARRGRGRARIPPMRFARWRRAAIAWWRTAVRIGQLHPGDAVRPRRRRRQPHPRRNGDRILTPPGRTRSNEAVTAAKRSLKRGASGDLRPFGDLAAKKCAAASPAIPQRSGTQASRLFPSPPAAPHALHAGIDPGDGLLCRTLRREQRVPARFSSTNFIPSSLKVGTSGSWTARLFPDTARARNRPAGYVSDVATERRQEQGEAAGYEVRGGRHGPCRSRRSLIPARSLNSTVARCALVPVPSEP